MNEEKNRVKCHLTVVLAVVHNAGPRQSRDVVPMAVATGPSGGGGKQGRGASGARGWSDELLTRGTTNSATGLRSHTLAVVLAVARALTVVTEVM